MHITSTWIASLALVSASWLPGTARAAGCDADTLSDSWAAKIGRCLPESIVETGSSVAKEWAKDLVKSALGRYMPGLGQLIFGSGSSDTQRILDAIEAARNDILAQQIQIEFQGISSDYAATLEDYARFETRSLASKLLAYQDLGDVVRRLSTIRNRFSGQQVVFGIGGMHMVVTVLNLELIAMAEHEALRRMAQQSTSLASLSVTDRIQHVQAAIATMDQLGGASLDAVETYLRDLDARGALRTASDARFGSLTRLFLPFCNALDRCPRSYMFRVTPEPRYDGTPSGPARTYRLEVQPSNHATMGWTLQVNDHLGRGLLEARASRPAKVIPLDEYRPTYAYDTQFDRSFFEDYKQYEYQEYLSRTYGAVRPLLNRIRRSLGRTGSQLSWDDELRAFAGGEWGIGPAEPEACERVGEARRSLFSGLAGPSPDSAVLTDYVLMHGHQALEHFLDAGGRMERLDGAEVQTLMEAQLDPGEVTHYYQGRRTAPIVAANAVLL